MNPALFSSAKEDWETPREFFERLDGEFHFDLDVCAFPHNAKCPAYFTKEDDGLARDWGNRVCWMNPPYGKAIKAWMTKALDASRRGATVVCLVPSRTASYGSELKNTCMQPAFPLSHCQRTIPHRSG